MEQDYILWNTTNFKQKLHSVTNFTTNQVSDATASGAKEQWSE
jgi:hypothetical protein